MGAAQNREGVAYDAHDDDDDDDDVDQGRFPNPS